MKARDFRRIALSLDGAEEGSHMGAADFRVGGRIFATLAHEKEGYGNLMLTPEQQPAFVEDLPEVFLPVHCGWGRMGATHVRLAAVSEDVLEGALRTARKLRTEKNVRLGKKDRSRSSLKSPHAKTAYGASPAHLLADLRVTGLTKTRTLKKRRVRHPPRKKDRSR